MQDLSPKPSLSTRFAPTEKPRQVIESSLMHPTKLASQVGFSPVATMNIGDNKVYVRPVKNTNTRAVSPGVVGSTGQVAVHGERSVSLTADMHSQLKTKTDRVVENYVSQKPSPQTNQKYISPEDLMPEHFAKVANIPVQQAPALLKPTIIETKPLVVNGTTTKPTTGVTPPTTTTSNHPISTQDTSELRNEELKKQLEQINKMLFEQIKQKITLELARVQKTTLAPKADVSEKPKPIANTQTTTAQPFAPEKNPVIAARPASNQLAPELELKQKLGRPVVKTEVPTHWEQKTPTLAEPTQTLVKKIEPGSDQFKSQIDRLEGEIKILVKEVEDLDKTVKSLEAEKANTELTTLERRIEVDQKMLAAIAEWRMALNNLINSHSIAIKYLKEKTDYLEQQTSHETKHNKFHHRPEEIGKISTFPLPIINPPASIEVYDNNRSSISHQGPVVAVPSQPKPAPVQTPSFEVVKDLVKQAMDKEKSQTPQVPAKPDEMVVKNLVNEVLEKEKQALQATQPIIQQAQPDINAVRDLVKGVLNEELPKAIPSGSVQPNQINTVYVKEVDKATVIPENAQTGVVIKEQPVISTGSPIINISTADIEKQILEQAEKEEAVKEAVRQAKEKAQQKIQEERNEKERAVSESAKQSSNTQLKISDPTQEMIKSEVDKLKASLTTIDNKQLVALSKDQRTDMIRKLENLEKDTLISKQFDEIKSSAERRRINAELTVMLHQLGQKPPESLPANQNPQQRMQTLKVEEKKQTSPAQKAHLIAEIKELERQSQARKAAERSRPTVKAQPAFGKMLPNTPTVPNVINGIVKDPKGLLLSTVVIIVKDTKSDPVRAFKTNKLGQFALSTPVPNGVYTLELEKDGYDFDIIEVDVNGAIMQPIEIKAK